MGGTSVQQASLIQQIVTISFGFFLTTVLGGILARYLQERTWKHQRGVQKRDDDLKERKQLFEEISRLMDRRLYRMKQLSTAISRRQEDEEMFNDRLSKYRDVLFEWNDNINRNLALLQIYFGHSLREKLDNDVGARFVKVGSVLEAAIRDGRIEKGKIDQELRKLSSSVYEFNLSLLKHIREPPS